MHIGRGSVWKQPWERREGEKDEGPRSGEGKSPAKVKGKEFWQRINVSVLFTYCLGLNLKSGEYRRNSREIKKC